MVGLATTHVHLASIGSIIDKGPDMDKTGHDTSVTVDGGSAITPPGAVPSLDRRGEGSVVRRHSGLRKRGMLTVVGAVAAAAVAVGVTAALHTPRPASAVHTPLPASPSALSVVTSALARTSADSYTYTVDSITRFAGKELNSVEVSGAFDPGHHLGTEQLNSRSAGRVARAQVRFICKYLYTSVTPAAGFVKLWDKSLLTAAAANGTPPGDPYEFVSDQPVTPDELTVVLRSAGAVMHDAGPVSGPGWTGTRYTFTAHLYGGRESVTGTVYVDRQGRVRRLMTITTDLASPKRATKNRAPATYREITFSGFGAPVRVGPPPVSQLKYTSGNPYWGFYF